jgi:hypothetical protein
MMKNDDRGRGIFEHLPTAKALLEEDTNNYIDEWLVPTVLIHEYGLGAGGIKAQDYEYIKDHFIGWSHGDLRVDDQEFNYIHWYKHKDRVKTPKWHDIPSTFNVKDYILV